MSQSASLYVGDLHPDVDEATLNTVFREAGNVASIRLCRDNITRRSLGYAYVNFFNPEDAERAMESLNYTRLVDKPIRIMWCQRDPSLRRSGVGNVYISNLDEQIDNKALYDTFSLFGNIISCKVAMDETGKSRGYGFVHFETEASAKAAVEKVNGKEMLGKIVTVSPWRSRQQRVRNLFVRDFPASFSDEKLSELFSPYGELRKCSILRKEDGSSKGFAYVSYFDSESARKAMEGLNGVELDGKRMIVSRWINVTERARVFRMRFSERPQVQNVNVYVKNLPESFDDDQLREFFAPFGNITSHKVMRNTDGTSRGFGFVCFSTPEEATRAINENNGRMLDGKPLYLALAQKKEQRRMMIQAIKNQGLMFQSGRNPSIPGGPMIPTGIYYAQPGMMGGVPMRSQYPPMSRPRWEGNNMQPEQHQFMNTQQNARGRRRHVNQRGGNVGGRGQQQASYRLNSNARNPNAPQGPMMVADGGAQRESTELQQLAQQLVNASSEDRRQILGERLYPLVEQILVSMDRLNYTPKTTGMLLLMDTSDVLLLLESPLELQEKVRQAVMMIDEESKHVDG